MNTNAWLCLTNLSNWEVIKKEKIYGFNEQKIRWGTILMGRSIIKLKQSDYNHIKRLIRNAENEQDL